MADDRITVCVVHRNNPHRYVEIRAVRSSWRILTGW